MLESYHMGQPVNEEASLLVQHHVMSYSSVIQNKNKKNMAHCF
jgi:hypothetical protein